MVRRARCARVVAVALGLVIFACACAGVATPTPAPASPVPGIPAASQGAAPVVGSAGPYPTPEPIRWGGAMLVTGTEICAASDVSVATPDPSGRVHVIAGDLTCTVAMNDPRVSGTKSGPLATDAWGTWADGAFIRWGSPPKIVNDGGTWVGMFIRDRAPRPDDLRSVWFAGTGDYAGLWFIEWTEAPPGAAFVRRAVDGITLSGNPPEPSPAPP